MLLRVYLEGLDDSGDQFGAQVLPSQPGDCDCLARRGPSADRAASGRVVRFLSEVFGSVERELWDDGRGAFVDSTVNRRCVPQDGNSVTIVSGLVKEPERVKRILAYMRDNLWESWGPDNVDVPFYRLTPGFPWHNQRVMPFMNYYEALARYLSGDDEGAMELLRRCWGYMVGTEPGTTFWEWKSRRGQVDVHFCSLCHGWSAGVVPLLSKFVLGIGPVGVAYKQFQFDPRPAGLEWVEGRVPVKGGLIEARV